MIKGYQTIPDMTLLKMRLIDTIDVGSGSVPSVGDYSIIRFYIRGNDITNPFTTFSPDQPAGILQWGGFYQNAIVHKSALQVTPIISTSDVNNPTSNFALPYQVSIVPLDENSSVSPFLPFDEQPYSKTKMFNSVGTSAIFGTNNINAQYGNNTKSSVYNSMMTKKILGYKDLADVDDVRCDISPSVSPPAGVPATQWYWGVEIKSLLPLPVGGAAANYTLGDFQVRCAEYFNVQLLNRIPIVDINEQ